MLPKWGEDHMFSLYLWKMSCRLGRRTERALWKTFGNHVQEGNLRCPRQCYCPVHLKGSSTFLRSCPCRTSRKRAWCMLCVTILAIWALHRLFNSWFLRGKHAGGQRNSGVSKMRGTRLCSSITGKWGLRFLVVVDKGMLAVKANLLCCISLCCGAWEGNIELWCQKRLSTMELWKSLQCTLRLWNSPRYTLRWNPASSIR